MRKFNGYEKKISRIFLYEKIFSYLCSVLPRLQPPKIQKNAEVGKVSTELKQFETKVKGQ